MVLKILDFFILLIFLYILFRRKIKQEKFEKYFFLDAKRIILMKYKRTNFFIVEGKLPEI